MAAQPVLHPSEETLRAFALCKLDDDSASVLMSHLDDCPTCCQAVAALSGDDFLNRLRQAHGNSFTPAPAKEPAAVLGAANPSPSLSQTPISTVPPELAAHSQYEIMRELGRGGMGVVYLAKNKLMDRLEVLKVVNKTLLDRPGAVERFLREIRSAAKLNHANVVGAYSAVQQGELLAFAMEYIAGQDLAHVVKSQGPLPVAYACYYVQQAALGLQHAFEKGMVHRDIKPQNLILAREGKKHTVKVLDFGLAKVLREKSEDTGLTGEGKMLGTPDFIAPEQTLDAARADIRADIYSLGCTLYYLLAGMPPFKGRSLFEVLQAHHSMEARPLNLVRSEVPEELAAVVRRMMAKDPAKRYQTPLDVVQALAPFIKQRALPKAALELSSGAAEVKSAIKKVEGTVPPPVPTPKAAEHPSEKVKVPGTLIEGSSVFIELQKSAVSRKPRAATAKVQTRKKKWLIGGSIGIGALLLALLGMWVGGVFKVKTKDGTIVLENLPADAQVMVDGDTVTLQDKDGRPVTINVAVGKKHQLQVKKEGFKVFGDTVEIESGEQRAIRVRLEPLPVAAADGERRTAKPETGTTKADYDAFAAGRWVRILSAPGGSVVSKGAVIKDGMVEANDGKAVDRAVQAKDMIVRAKVKKVSGRNIALLARQDVAEPLDGNRYAAWFIGNDRFGVGKIADHKWTNLREGAVPAPARIKDGEYFEFAFAVVGDTLTVYLNGRRVLEVRDEAAVPVSGAAGVSTDWCVGQFKDIEVQILDPAAKSAPEAGSKKSPPDEVLTPAQAALKVGKKVKVQFRVKGSGLNSGGIPQLLSEDAWNKPGCFFIRFLKPTCDKYNALGIPNVCRHFHGKAIRVTGTITSIRFGGVKGSFGCIYVNDPEEVSVISR